MWFGRWVSGFVGLPTSILRVKECGRYSVMLRTFFGLEECPRCRLVGGRVSLLETDLWHPSSGSFTLKMKAVSI